MGMDDPVAKANKAYLQTSRIKRSVRHFYEIVVLIATLGLAFIHFAEAIETQILFFSAHIIEEVGKAMLIAAILAVSVDVFLKKRLASEFVRDVSPFIEGIGLPEEFQDEIACIRRMAVYRKNWKLTYRVLRDSSLPAGFIRLKVSTSFDVINPTEEPQVFEHITSSEHMYKHLDPPKITAGKIRSGEKDVQAHSVQICDQKGQATDVYECKNRILLQPKSMDLTCWSEMDDVAEISDSDIFYLTYPTVDVSVHVEAPDDIEVSVYIGHRYQDYDPPRVIKIPPEPAKTHTWRLAAAMIEWSSIYIEWTPTKAKGPTQESKAQAAHTDADD